LWVASLGSAKAGIIGRGQGLGLFIGSPGFYLIFDHLVFSWLSRNIRKYLSS
jgi:hypothetical protein